MEAGDLSLLIVQDFQSMEEDHDQEEQELLQEEEDSDPGLRYTFQEIP